jgi:hypothetical protein
VKNNVNIYALLKFVDGHCQVVALIASKPHHGRSQQPCRFGCPQSVPTWNVGTKIYGYTDKVRLMAADHEISGEG